MSKANDLSLEKTGHVRDACLCLHVQRAARALARHFDEVMRPLGLTHGQFSLLMSLNRPQAPTMSGIAAFLAMDRTTLTANLKPLERCGLARVTVDEQDRRNRRLAITDAGRALLVEAFPVWQKAHAEVERRLAGLSADEVRSALKSLSL